MPGLPFEKTRALVIGGGGEIGRAIAARLTERHGVVLIDRDRERLSAAAGVLPDETTLIEADAAVDGEIAAVLKEALTDGVLGVVAIAVGTTEGGSLSGLDAESWRRVVDSNLTSVFQSLRAVVEQFERQGSGGAICVVGSVHASSPVPGFPAYASAKAGVVALAQQAAAEYGHAGIRVNVVTPGWTQTAHTMTRLSDGDHAALIDATPLRLLAEPGDIASAVSFLLGDGARVITGAEVIVDGGASLIGGASVLRSRSRTLLGLD